MPEDKKKFKKQNLSSLIHEAVDTPSASSENRDSASPAPGVRRLDTLTSSTGQYKLSTIKKSAREDSTWEKDDKSEKAPKVSEEELHQKGIALAHRLSPPTNSISWNDMDEDESWDLPEVKPAKPESSPTSSAASPSPAWNTQKAVPAARLEDEIKKLKKNPTPPAKTVKNHDGLSRFRMEPRIDSQGPDPLSRDLKDTRIPSRFEREPFRRFDRDFDRDFGRERERGMGRFEDDDLDWHRGQPLNSMSRNSRPAPTGVLRPIKLAASAVSPPAAVAPVAAAVAAPEPDQTKSAEDKIKEQHEMMQKSIEQARERMRLKEEEEERAKQARLEQKLRELEERARSKEEARQKELAQKRQEKERHDRERHAKEEQKDDREREQRTKQHEKEKKLQESWFDRKKAAVASGQALSSNSMRRRRGDQEAEAKPVITGATSAAIAAASAAIAEIYSPTNDETRPVKLSLPTYDIPDAGFDERNPLNGFYDKFSVAEREPRPIDPSHGKIRVYLPTWS